MTSPEDFNHRCNKFNEVYTKAKSNVNSLKDLSSHALIPIEQIVEEV